MEEVNKTILVFHPMPFMAESFGRFVVSENISEDSYCASSYEQLHRLLSVYDFDVIIIDLNFANEYLKEILRHSPDMVVVITSLGFEKHKVWHVLELVVNTPNFVSLSSDIEELSLAIKRSVVGDSWVCHEVIKILLNKKANQNVFNQLDELTKREMEVLLSIASGLTNQEIAGQMFVSVRTIDSHRRNIMSKLNLRNTAGIVKYAYENRLIELKRKK